MISKRRDHPWVSDDASTLKNCKIRAFDHIRFMQPRLVPHTTFVIGKMIYKQKKKAISVIHDILHHMLQKTNAKMKCRTILFLVLVLHHKTHLFQLFCFLTDIKKIINFSSGFRQTTLINYRYHGVLADKLKLNKMLSTLRFNTGVINKIDWRKFYSRTKMWKKRLLAKIEIAIDCI